MSDRAELLPGDSQYHDKGAIMTEKRIKELFEKYSHEVDRFSSAVFRESFAAALRVAIAEETADLRRQLDTFQLAHSQLERLKDDWNASIRLAIADTVRLQGDDLTEAVRLLGPMARAASGIPDNWPDNYIVIWNCVTTSGSFTIGDCRAAARFVAEQKEKVNRG